ncbi:hypothetical protein IVB12_15590 [Bradyrhizobium sp. 179]|uniref:hypothetical protein n=1 Tax=Bradyrhizobium sp. 179 TaxID=2782648 RepID=UPI001FFA266C|nr:hypothetical protein [Bradyrhizobium sp. 179]MCK1543338.1 hypothetical protein [Bradyrhizobium sp. 179]
MIRPEKQGSRKHMTPLEKGLAICARRSGMPWDHIAEALKRDEKTIKRAFRQHPELLRNAQTIRKSTISA